MYYVGYWECCRMGLGKVSCKLVRVEILELKDLNIIILRKLQSRDGIECWNGYVSNIVFESISFV